VLRTTLLSGVEVFNPDSQHSSPTSTPHTHVAPPIPGRSHDVPRLRHWYGNPASAQGTLLYHGADGTVLCVTRTRVPYIASTTLVHRNIVASNALSFYPHSSFTKHSDQTSLTA
jgi:hypothetical protein